MKPQNWRGGVQASWQRRQQRVHYSDSLWHVHIASSSAALNSLCSVVEMHCRQTITGEKERSNGQNVPCRYNGISASPLPWWSSLEYLRCVSPGRRMLPATEWYICWIDSLCKTCRRTNKHTIAKHWVSTVSLKNYTLRLDISAKCSHKCRVTPDSSCKHPIQ